MTTQNKLIEQIAPDLVSSIPNETAVSFKILPLAEYNGKLHLATYLDADVKIINDLQFILGKEVVLQKWKEEEIEKALEHFYINKTEIMLGDYSEYKVVEKALDIPSNGNVNQETDELSIIETVNKIISKAINQRASDIHIEPYERQLRIRYRIDGALHNRDELQLALKNAIISRIKIMADLDIAERRRPQDGRIRVTNGEKTIDIRVSTLPTDFGEKVVLRILDKGALQLEFSSLSFDEEELVVFKDAALSPYGMLLVTGPTGSGKTTTLYATLNYLNAEGVNILTIEDPIEYNLQGINQAHMRADIGFTFARALKTFLRQDPDIIMVGEIRDFETAEIAVRAALTGHLVLSTLHTNDAPSAITRLVDMGVEPFLVASCVRLVVAQRLVRKICSFCKREVTLSIPTSASISLKEKNVLKRNFIGGGCKDCFETGYQGRTALFEIMCISPHLAQQITQSKTSLELGELAMMEGMKTLRLSGLEKINKGITTLEEILRETRG